MHIEVDLPLGLKHMKRYGNLKISLFLVQVQLIEHGFSGLVTKS